jgi:hypothetical protein
MSKRLEELSEGYFLTVNGEGPDERHLTTEELEPCSKHDNPRDYELGERVTCLDSFNQS